MVLLGDADDLVVTRAAVQVLPAVGRVLCGAPELPSCLGKHPPPLPPRAVNAAA